MKSFKQFLNEREQSKGVSVQGVHYSKKPGLTHLEGRMSGTGIKGAEQSRLQETKDNRIKNRVYFYNHTGGDLPRPEQGLGPHIHTATLHNIYDPSTASDEHRAEVEHHKAKHAVGFHNASNTFESAVVDAGYHGYTNRGMTVVLNHTVPVSYQGSRFDKKVA